MLLSFSSYPHFPFSHQLLHLVSIEVVHVVVLRGLVILILIERTSRKAYIDGLGGCLINSVIWAIGQSYIILLLHGSSWMEQFTHLTWLLDTVVIVQWLLRLRGNAGLVGTNLISFRLVRLYEAMLCLKDSAWVFVMYLILVSRYFDCRSQLVWVNSIVVLNWYWIVLIDQIILICIFNGQIPISSTLLINPAQLRSNTSQWRC